jgi:hypothetical protein
MKSEDTAEDKVWVTVKYTVNLGDFESSSIEIGTSQTVTEKTADHARKRLCAKLMSEVVELGETQRRKIKHYQEQED